MPQEIAPSALHHRLLVHLEADRLGVEAFAGRHVLDECADWAEPDSLERLGERPSRARR
jgi:hypothetical protein